MVECVMSQCFIPVAIDIKKIENEQKSVDAGHSPWKLDPKFVAQVFVSLLIHPEGISGDYPINYDNLKVVQYNGIQSIVKINDENSPVSFVYLERIIRPDNTGIWTIIAYVLK